MDRYDTIFVLPIALFVVIWILALLAFSDSHTTVSYSVSSQTQTRLDSAKRAVSTICAQQGGAVFFDVQDQNELVYACHKNDKLRLYPY